MKKLLGTTLALAMLLPAGANAELLKNLKVTGKIDLQGTAARNVADFQTNRNVSAAVDAQTGQDRIGDMQTRVIVSADWDLLDDVHSRVTLVKNDRVWGSAAQSVTGLEASFFAQEAFIKIDKLGGHVDASLGRQFIGEEGDLVAYFGPKTNLYGMLVDALDAAKFDMSGEHWTLTALTGKPTSNAATLGLAATGQKDIRAIIIGCKGHEMVHGQLQLWNQATHNATGPIGTSPGVATAGAKNDNLYIAGLKVTVKAGPAWIKGEFDKNFGENRSAEGLTTLADRKYTGWAGLVNAGAKVEAGSLGMVSGWGEYGIGSGDSDTLSNKNSGFVSINSDYRPGSLYGRFAANATATTVFGNLIGASVSPAGNGLSNRVVKGLGVKFTPAALNKLTTSLSAWDFSFQNTGRAPQTQGGQPTIGANGNRHIGNEYDLELAWQHSENVMVKLGAATFQSGGFIIESQKLASPAAAQRGNNPAYLLTSDFSVRF